MCQLEKQRANVANSDRRKYTDLTDAIGILRAAEKLTVENISKTNITLTREAAKIVVDAGHNIQLPNQMVICKQYCVELMENQKDGEWSESVAPILRSESDVPVWSESQPLWAALVLDSDSANLAKVWPDAVFTNALWNMIESMSNNSSRNRLAKVCRLFLAATEHCLEALMRIEGAGADFVPTFSAVRQTMTGLYGLACPAPGRAALDDILYVLPANSSSAKLNADLPGGSGRALVSMLKKDKGNIGVQAGEYFQITVGYSQQVADEFVALEQQVDLTLDTLGVGNPDCDAWIRPTEIQTLPTDQAKMCIGTMDQYSKNARSGQLSFEMVRVRLSLTS